MVEVVLLSVLLCSVLFYFCVFTDMKQRKENRIFWFLRFILLGPLAVSWYKSVRSLKENEVRPGGIFYNLARTFIGPWSIYVLALPVILFSAAGALDLLDGTMNSGHIGELIMWMVILYIFIIIPIWVFPALVSLIVILTGPKKEIQG